MSPTWYDLLGVEPSASPEEIRAAWKAAVADLDPTDRRFGTLSEAAAVLLDEDRRRDYDASLPEPAEPVASQPSEPSAPSDASQPSVGRVASASERIETPDTGLDTSSPSGSGYSTSEGRSDGVRRPPAAWLLALLAVVALLTVTLAAYAVTRPDHKAIEEQARQAQSAAETAIAEVLSYDYRTLDEDERTATSFLTPRYQRDAYDDVWDTIARNAPETRTVVTATVVGSSIVRAGEDRTEVLVLVDRPTTNKKVTEPVVYEDHVTVTMVRTGDEWLIDDLRT